MTSTSINIGLGEKTRLSSRVLQPPGGGHTDIFGGEPEPPRTGRRMASNPAVVAAAHAATATAAAAATAAEAAKTTAVENAVAPLAEQPAPAAPAPEPAQEVKAAAAAPAPPQQTNMAPPPAPGRVRVPPGGFSSGLW